MTKKLLCMMLILGLSAATANATLVGWWKFDEAGGGDALDSAPAAGANTGVSNGTTPRVASGVAGLGLAADLTPNGAGDNFFDVGTASGALNPADVFSVAAWVNVKGNGGGAWGGPSSAFGFGDCCAGTAAGAADRHAFELDIDDSPQRAIFAIDSRGNGGGEAEIITSGIGTTVGVWHHIVGVREADGSATLYVNGSGSNGGSGLASLAPDGTVDATGGSGPDHVQNRINLGRNPFADPSGDRAFNGHLGDVQFYHSALTGAEVSQLYNNPGTAIPEPSTLLLLVVGIVGLVGSSRRR